MDNASGVEGEGGSGFGWPPFGARVAVAVGGNPRSPQEVTDSVQIHPQITSLRDSLKGGASQGLLEAKGTQPRPKA